MLLSKKILNKTRRGRIRKADSYKRNMQSRSGKRVDAKQKIRMEPTHYENEQHPVNENSSPQIISNWKNQLTQCPIGRQLTYVMQKNALA